ncbi:carbohydrate-binding protein [Paenibacillus sp. MB22_1]|uniref:carbohydrate-binding protein n=1 Tax=unclassified Paenibacillus TaxID=185978 RepID=UPI0030DDBEC3
MEKVTGTGGWQEFKVFSAEVTAPVRGKHIVFLYFKGSDWLFNLDKFTLAIPPYLRHRLLRLSRLVTTPHQERLSMCER